MERIICDTYVKGEKHTWNLDKDNPSNQEFNRKILAVNNMYGWLYKKGLLRDVSFEIKDYSDVVFFALDVKDLEPYREAMEASGLKDSDVALRHIFDEYYTPCEYSGAIELGWTMMGYRDVDGCVSRSWECGLVKGLNTRAAHDVLSILDEKGVKEAVSAAFELAGFEPDLFVKAFEHYSQIDRSMGDYREYLDYHGDKLIYCYQNNLALDLIDVDFWVQYETLLGERLSFEEYGEIDSQFDGDPHDIDADDTDKIAHFREVLEAYRSENKNLCRADNIQGIIEDARDRSVGKPAEEQRKEDLEFPL